MGVGAKEMGKEWSVGEFLGTLPLLAGQASGREEPSWLSVGHLGAKSNFEGFRVLSQLALVSIFRVRVRVVIGLH